MSFFRPQNAQISSVSSLANALKEIPPPTSTRPAAFQCHSYNKQEDVHCVERAIAHAPIAEWAEVVQNPYSSTHWDQSVSQSRVDLLYGTCHHDGVVLTPAYSAPTDIPAATSNLPPDARLMNWDSTPFVSVVPWDADSGLHALHRHRSPTIDIMSEGVSFSDTSAVVQGVSEWFTGSNANGWTSHQHASTAHVWSESYASFEKGFDPLMSAVNSPPQSFYPFTPAELSFHIQSYSNPLPNPAEHVATNLCHSPYPPSSTPSSPPPLPKKTKSQTSRKYRIDAIVPRSLPLPTDRQSQPDLDQPASPSVSGKRAWGGGDEPEHVHITNVVCPHPSCSGPIEVAEPGVGPTVIFPCGYVDPKTGRPCPSDFRRRGCRDRHAGSHGGREAQDVSAHRLAPGAARRLLWETIRLVEAADWSCVHPQENVPRRVDWTTHYENSAASIRAEFDVIVLAQQAQEVKQMLLATAGQEPVPSAYPYIAPVDLSAHPQFERLVMKRSMTFERYFCRHPRCDADFTRMDALVRHRKTCHQRKPKTKREKSEADD